MMKMIPGQNSQLKSSTLDVQVAVESAEDSVVMIEVAQSGNRVVGLEKTENGRFKKTLSLSDCPDAVEKHLILVLSETSSHSPLSYAEAEIRCSGEVFSMLPDLSDKGISAAVIGEIYKRNGNWKLRFLGDGHKTIEAAATAFSVSADQLKVRQQAASPSPQPAKNSSVGSGAQDFNLQETLTRGRSMWNKIKAAVRTKSEEMATEVQKFKNKEFLNAAMAGSVLVAVADGSVSSEEKQKMIKFIKANQALKVFDSKKVIETFNQYLDVVEFDLDAGRAECFDALAKLKGKEDQARLVIRMVIAIGESDGDFDADERKVVEEISKEMNVSFQ